MEVVENNYTNIYYIMKHREILNILILVGSAFLLVAVLSYFNLYEGMEHELYEGLDEKEGLEEEEGMEPKEPKEPKEPVMDGFDNMPHAPDPAAPGAAPGAATVLKFATF